MPSMGNVASGHVCLHIYIYMCGVHVHVCTLLQHTRACNDFHDNANIDDNDDDDYDDADHYPAYAEDDDDTVADVQQKDEDDDDDDDVVDDCVVGQNIVLLPCLNGYVCGRLVGCWVYCDIVVFPSTHKAATKITTTSSRPYPWLS